MNIKIKTNKNQNTYFNNGTYGYIEEKENYIEVNCNGKVLKISKKELNNNE